MFKYFSAIFSPNGWFYYQHNRWTFQRVPYYSYFGRRYLFWKNSKDLWKFITWLHDGDSIIPFNCSWDASILINLCSVQNIYCLCIRFSKIYLKKQKVKQVSKCVECRLMSSRNRSIICRSEKWGNNSFTDNCYIIKDAKFGGASVNGAATVYIRSSTVVSILCFALTRFTRFHRPMVLLHPTYR